MWTWRGWQPEPPSALTDRKGTSRVTYNHPWSSHPSNVRTPSAGPSQSKPRWLSAGWPLSSGRIHALQPGRGGSRSWLAGPRRRPSTYSPILRGYQEHIHPRLPLGGARRRPPDVLPKSFSRSALYVLFVHTQPTQINSLMLYLSNLRTY